MLHYHYKKARFVLLPEELFFLANAHENREKVRYEQLSICFQSFDTGCTRLMKELARECEARLDKQRKASLHLGLSSEATAESAPTRAVTPHVKRHIFITHDAMAIEVITKAIAAAEYSLRFSEYLNEANITPELEGMLVTFVRQKQLECRIVQEALDAFNRTTWKTPPAEMDSTSNPPHRPDPLKGIDA
ncbi:hypothetical protein L861_14370 [Litchfieldella anticariensis FP35 = DSM 16096]|uniref:Ferritin/DPS protein domain-containing protein n=1 Tax=Litchfieldella anticariensis (strain DSM 16096 / CECT 5854 / CIP 108499 / LMG 22089 / FP35) TaxID=1121939 RepID=S2KJD0_LITA3|nr:hypothetical protein [Halomonas anticariensis]EPC00453.1 hypothetical protein L861_14370 [Halomonas anticariensis FP35 = DSM 16096]